MKNNSRKQTSKLVFVSTISTVIMMSTLTGYGLPVQVKLPQNAASDNISQTSLDSSRTTSNGNEVLQKKLDELLPKIETLEKELNNLSQRNRNDKNNLQRKVKKTAREIEDILITTSDSHTNIQLQKTSDRLRYLLLKPLQHPKFIEGVKQIQFNLDVPNYTQNFGTYGSDTNQKVQEILLETKTDIYIAVMSALISDSSNPGGTTQDIPSWLLPLLGVLGFLAIAGSSAFFWKLKEASTLKQELDTKKNDWDKASREGLKKMNDMTKTINQQDSTIKQLQEAGKQTENQSNLGYENRGYAATPSPIVTPPMPPVRSTPAATVSPPMPVVTSDDRIAAAYNNDPRQFTNHYQTTAVSEDTDSLNRRRAGGTQTLVLTKNPQGKYLVFNAESTTYLVPHHKIEIDQYTITTLEGIFDCQGSKDNYEKIMLIEPARVISSGDKTWQLQSKGKLRFS